MTFSWLKLRILTLHWGACPCATQSTVTAIYLLQLFHFKTGAVNIPLTHLLSVNVPSNATVDDIKQGICDELWRKGRLLYRSQFCVS